MKNILFIFIFLAGCAQPVRYVDSGVGEGLVGVKGQIEAADADLAIAAHKTLGPAKDFVLAARDRLTAANGALDVTARDAKQSREECAKDQAARDQFMQQLADERGHWIGYRLRVCAKWVIGIALALWAAAGIFGIVSGLCGLGGVSAFIMRAIPLANLFALVRDRLKPQVQ